MPTGGALTVIAADAGSAVVMAAVTSAATAAMTAALPLAAVA